MVAPAKNRCKPFQNISVLLWFYWHVDPAGMSIRKPSRNLGKTRKLDANPSKTFFLYSYVITGRGCWETGFAGEKYILSIFRLKIVKKLEKREKKKRNETLPKQITRFSLTSVSVAEVPTTFQSASEHGSWPGLVPVLTGARSVTQKIRFL